MPKERKIAITIAKIFDTLAIYGTGSLTRTEDRRDLYAMRSANDERRECFMMSKCNFWTVHSNVSVGLERGDET